MPNPVEGLPEVYEDMVDVLLVLEIYLTEASQVKDLLCGALSSSEACLFFSDDLLRLWLQSVQYDLQRDFIWVTEEADRAVVLTLPQVAFLGSVMTTHTSVAFYEQDTGLKLTGKAHLVKIYLYRRFCEIQDANSFSVN